MKREKALEVETASAPDGATAVTNTEIETMRIDELAKSAGLLPQFMATGKPSRPMAQNRNYWLYRCICDRYRWNEHTRITQAEFDAAIAAVRNFSV